MSDQQQQLQQQQQREQQLREAIANQERNRQALAMAVATGRADPRELQRFEESLKDISTKLAHAENTQRQQAQIQSYIDTHLKPYLDPEFARSQGVEVNQGEVQAAIEANEQTIKQLEGNKAAVYGKAAPFVDMAKGTIDIAEALKFGLSDAEIRELGASQTQIVRTRRDIATRDFHKGIDKKVEMIQSEKQAGKISHTEALTLKAEAEKMPTSKTVPDYQGQLAVDEVNKIQSAIVYKKPDYAKAEAEFNKVADKIWARTDIDLDEKVSLAKDTREWRRLQEAISIPEKSVKSVLLDKTPAYLKAESEFNKVADGIWARTDIDLDEKTRLAMKTPEWEKLQEATEHQNKNATSKLANSQMALNIATWTLPVVATVRHWDEMSPTMRAVSILSDALFFYGVAGAAVRASRGAATLGQKAMFKATGKALAQEVGGQIAAPVQVIIRPVETIKAVGKQVKNVAENIADFRKVPYSVLTTTDGTVRIRIDSNFTPAQAAAARDVVMEAASKGKRLIIQSGNNVIEVATSPFMREVRKAGGSVAHATPAGEVFEKALKAAVKVGKPLKEQGIFFSHEPLPKFSQQSAFGGVKASQPTIYIASQETAAKMVSSNKIYRNTAELERVLPVGASTSGAQQRLYTRIGSNADEVVILLEKPLSVRQISTLKAESLIEAVKAPFSPAIKVKGAGKAIKGLTAVQVDDLARTLRVSGNIDQARNLVTIFRIASPVRVTQPGRLLSDSPVFRNIPEREIVQARRTLETVSERDTAIFKNEIGRIPTRTDTITETPQSEPRIEAVSKETRTEAVKRDGESQSVTERTGLPAATVERVAKPSSTRTELKPIPRTSTAKSLTLARPVVPVRPEFPVRFRRPDSPERPPAPLVEPGKPARIPSSDEPKKRKSQMTDEEKREYIKNKGFTAQNMGRLHGKDVWHIFLDNGERVVLLGEPPAGVRITADGAGSARATTQRVGTDKRFRPITHQHGAVVTRITPGSRTGAKADFVPNSRVRPGKRKAEPISSPSIKRGKQYFTKVGKTTAVSRRPLAKKRK